MYLDFNEKGKVKVDMKYCIKKMIEQYPRHVKPFKFPWNEKLFLTNEKSPALSKEDREVFHSAVMQGIFLVKRGRPVAEPAFSYFSTRVKCSAEQDRSKLEKTLDYLLFAIDDVLIIEADSKNNSHWHADASFGMHSDMKSHAGAVFTLGKG